jgi:hypothetical protein
MAHLRARLELPKIAKSIQPSTRVQVLPRCFAYCRLPTEFAAASCTVLRDGSSLQRIRSNGLGSLRNGHGTLRNSAFQSVSRSMSSAAVNGARRFGLTSRHGCLRHRLSGGRIHATQSTEAPTYCSGCPPRPKGMSVSQDWDINTSPGRSCGCSAELRNTGQARPILARKG